MLEKRGQYSTPVWKVCKKGGKKFTIVKNIGVKILQLLGVLKEGGHKSMILKKYSWEGLVPLPAYPHVGDHGDDGRWELSPTEGIKI